MEDETDLSRGCQPGEVMAVHCGFCDGQGVYPFGHPPSQASCGVCNGRGWVHMRAPYAYARSAGGRGASLESG